MRCLTCGWPPRFPYRNWFLICLCWARNHTTCSAENRKGGRGGGVIMGVRDESMRTAIFAQCFILFAKMQQLLIALDYPIHIRDPYNIWNSISFTLMPDLSDTIVGIPPYTPLPTSPSPSSQGSPWWSRYPRPLLEVHSSLIVQNPQALSEFPTKIL